MKLNRNTRAATKQKKLNDERRRKELRERIQKEVLVEFCTCGQCSPNVVSKSCRSNTELAKTLNTLQIPTTSGKIGSWQATTVKRLYKDWYVGNPLMELLAEQDGTD